MERLVDLTLVSVEYETDEIGQQIEDEEVTRTLLATLHSVSRQEWSMGAQMSLNPEGMAKLTHSGDYQDEEYLEIDGKRFAIYRTYPTDDGGIELYYRKIIRGNT